MYVSEGTEMCPYDHHTKVDTIDSTDLKTKHCLLQADSILYGTSCSWDSHCFPVQLHRHLWTISCCPLSSIFRVVDHRRIDGLCQNAQTVTGREPSI
ncbi:hypothetical protein SK128_000815 [Halocaridina rubra]|uniref:Uncharacterized protein n=1 Tax=Halocaridina rubra TaxID=373956 RepID=A0AAN8WIU3_HALRR